jgi:hypothetical protein
MTLTITLAALLALAEPDNRPTARPDRDGPELLPAKLDFSSRESFARLVFEERRGGRYVGEVAGNIRFTVSDPKVVEVVDGVARPKGNGRATITATGPSGSATAEVTVRDFERPFEWSFRNHVQSVMAKTGCSSGACHGAAAGKKGFKLSLRGYDAEGDHDVLTGQASGRRVDLFDPSNSILLLKPTAMVKHGGGKRFDPESPEYRVLAEWIAAGTPAPKKEDPRLTDLRVLPERVTLKAGATQQFLVRATFSDGHVEDVTRWAKYESASAEVATVDETGRVQTIGRGEGAITAWYLNRIVIATVVVPYDRAAAEGIAKTEPRPGDRRVSPPGRNNFIDDLVNEKLAELDLPASGPASDREFLRRAFLDTIGVPPTVAELEAFLADNRPDKRARLVDALLARPEFVDYWAYRLSDLLLVNSEKLAKPAMWSYYRFIREAVAANLPWDETVRRVITAQGSTLENGAANFYVLHQDPRLLTETISQTFLGLSINCARCHNHPLEKWTNEQYFAMANLVARVRIKDGAGAGNFTVFTVPSGEVDQPLTGRPLPPQPLDGKAIALDSTADRRAHLAAWLTAPENPYFARAIANRVWANYMAVGLVERVDDLRLTNPASNEKLLTALAEHHRDSKYDLKTLMRSILNSAAYQRSSVPVPGNEGDRRFYSRYYPRRLLAEVMIDAISAVTGSPTDFPGYPAGWRAMQLPDSKVPSYFLQRFGRPDREITCDCERTSEPNVVQALHLSNGDAINRKLQRAGNAVDQLLQAKLSPEAIVERIYLIGLARKPTPAESKELAEAILSASNDMGRRQAVEDVFWSVLNSKEFLFNH